jgi:hypothetical protein
MGVPAYIAYSEPFLEQSRVELAKGWVSPPASTNDISHVVGAGENSTPRPRRLGVDASCPRVGGAGAAAAATQTTTSNIDGCGNYSGVNAGGPGTLDSCFPGDSSRLR